MNNLISQSVKVPHRSGHYLGHHFNYTAGVGELVPILCHPLVPNSRVKLKTLLSAALAPLASDSFLRTSLRVEAFFCPTRFLYSGYEEWLTRDVRYPSTATQYSQRLGVRLPTLVLAGTTFKSYCGPGSLADFLGVRCEGGTANPNNDEIYDDDVIRLNIFPFLAYHYIWDCWYRNPIVQLPYFLKPVSGDTISSRNLPYFSISGATSSDYSVYPFTNIDAAFLSTRQRNFPIDYFTSALISPQMGDEETVTVDTSGGTSKVSVSAIRAANSLQIWRERLGLSGPRLVDYVRSNYGAHLSDGNARRPMFLGSGSIEVYSKGVDANTNQLTSGSQATQNPFDSVGARYGQANVNGECSLVDDFTCDEPGYLFVMASLVPKVNYASGVERYMLHYTRNGCEGDLANPILQNIGNQEIKCAELAAGDIIEPNGASSSTPRPAGNINSIFAFQQRYSEYMFRNDRVSGLYRDGQSLQSFMSQRVIAPSSTTPNQLNSSFLTIPKNYLDGVSAVQNQISQFGVMVDCYFDFAVSQPLYESSVPSLVNPAEEHGNNITIMRGGKRIV